MQLFWRWVFAAGALAAAVLAWGYAAQQPWAVATWPWRDGRLGNIFTASILAAVALPLGWVAATGRLGATLPGFVHLGVMLGGMASVLWPLGAVQQAPTLQAVGRGMALAALACALMALWARRQPQPDRRPLTPAMRAWFWLYIAILVPAGLAMLQQVPGIMPWPVNGVASQLYGWVFLSAVCSFAVPLLRPQVGYATVGLWGFLAYDAVLLGPFIAHFTTVRPELKTTLSAYTAVLVLTAAISLWFLWLSPATRLTAARAAT